jgi:hypothetical protein
LWLGYTRLFPVPVSAANSAKALVVLLVEDEFFVRYDIATCLKEAGYYMSGDRIGHERRVPGSVFLAKPLKHDDVLSVCRRLIQ